MRPFSNFERHFLFINIMNAKEKAKKLVEKHGKELAKRIVDGCMDELQIDWNQERIDYYLDVRFEIEKL